MSPSAEGIKQVHRCGEGVLFEAGIIDLRDFASYLQESNARKVHSNRPYFY
jgi:hypothetical protein